jgi:hypothetical protein
MKVFLLLQDFELDQQSPQGLLLLHLVKLQQEQSRHQQSPASTPQ